MEFMSSLRRKKWRESTLDGDATRSKIPEIILGGQDGVVNVLGLVLGVAASTMNSQVVIVAGLATTVAESLSMAAVAYTSTRAAQDYYRYTVKKEEKEIRKQPRKAASELRSLFHSKGVRGKLLSDIVKALEKNVRAGGETITEEGMHLQKSGRSEPWTAAFIVGLSSTIGSLIPLIPFFFLPVVQAMIAAAILALVSLFVGGWIKAKLTVGSPTRSGLELVVAGGLAALGGFIIGSLLQVPV